MAYSYDCTLFYLPGYGRHDDQVLDLISFPQDGTFINVTKTLFISIPGILFILWYMITTALMFIGALYGKFGLRSFENDEQYGELKSFTNYLNNKSRFMSHSDFLEYLRGRKT